MKFNFSAEFLRVEPPDTTFGAAWESLCHVLLSKESPSVNFQRLRAPDAGVDIYAKAQQRAYQCKANERGALGTADPAAAEASLKAAIRGRKTVPWKLYSIASNADFTVPGIERIRKQLSSRRLSPDRLEFLGPAYWHELCLKFADAIEDRFYYRITLAEMHVLEALKQARYYDRFVSEAQQKMRSTPVDLRVTCNRIHLEFKLPFSKELSIKNLLDVCKELYGINLDWVTFSSLNTSAGASVSIADGDKLVPFERKIGEIATTGETHLELWIKIIWQDGIREEAVSEDKVLSLMLYHPAASGLHDIDTLSYSGRRELTLSRFEDYVQNAMWERISLIKRSFD